MPGTTRKRKARQYTITPAKTTRRRLTYGRAALPRSVTNLTTGPLAKKLRCKLMYGATITMGSSFVSANSVKNFRANSLNDPDATGVGHQPRGYDQLKGLYEHSEVLGATIYVHFVNKHSTNAPIAGIFLADSISYPNDGYSMYEDGTCRFKRLSNANSGHSAQSVKHSINISKFTGTPKGADSLKCNADTDPADEVFFVIACHDGVKGVSDAQVEATIQIVYDVEFTQPRRINFS